MKTPWYKNTIFILPVILLIGFGIKRLYLMPKFDAGEQLDNFSAKLIDGRQFELRELSGSYVLVDFWGSWCGPCRRENSSLTKLYAETRNIKYNDAKSFEVISIAIEYNVEQWQKAIQKDALIWPYHIGEFDSFKSPLAKKYGVREIPTKYLLDPKGKIIMVNPDFEELSNFLHQKIAN